MIGPDYNLCNRSREEQDAASADTLACFWLHRLRAGEIKRHDIEAALRKMSAEQQKQHRDALNRNQPKFRINSGK